MTTITEVQTTQVYQVFIKATPEQIWDAITKPEFTSATSTAPGTRSRPTTTRRSARTTRSGATRTCSSSTRLASSSHGWRSLYSAELAAEEESRVTWEIEPGDDGVCLLTVVHDRLEGAPKTAANVSGAGWMGVLSGLKTLLETGESL